MKILLLIGLVALSGCNGSNKNQITGTQCASNYQPINNQAVASQAKVSLSADANGQVALKPGVYNYYRSDLFYEDALDAPLNNYRVHIQDTFDDKYKKFNATIVCTRNSHLDMGLKQVAAQTQGLQTFVVRPDRTIAPETLKTRDMGFEFAPEGNMNFKFNDAIQKPTQASAIYPTGFVFVHPENNNVIEIRSEGINAHGKWTMSNTFVRTDR